MEHVIIRVGKRDRYQEYEAWLDTTTDGSLYDPDTLAHNSSFLLCAQGSKTGRLAYLPVQQPLMLEQFAKRPGLELECTARVLTRLVEYAISEAFRRDVGEIYFLTRDESTLRFAERHHFRSLPDGLQVRRLNLLETFGC